MMMMKSFDVVHMATFECQQCWPFHIIPYGECDQSLTWSKCSRSLLRLTAHLRFSQSFNAKCQHDSQLNRCSGATSTTTRWLQSDSPIGEIYWHGWTLWSLSKSMVSRSLMDQPHQQRDCKRRSRSLSHVLRVQLWPKGKKPLLYDKICTFFRNRLVD